VAKKVYYELGWPVGLGVWVALDGAWLKGVIEARPNCSLARVRLDCGKTLDVGFSHGRLRCKDPLGVPVPHKWRHRPKKGLRTKLFETNPETGKILRRKEGIWSSVAPACLGCGTDSKPHEARGLCRGCYSNYRYRNNVAGARDKSLARLKLFRLTDPRAEEQDRRKAELRRTDPTERERHRQASSRWAAKFAKWPIGSKVECSLGNFDIGDRKVTLTKRASSARPFIRGEILETNNGSALVQFGAFAHWTPFARLQKIPAYADTEAA
jgi:hypothetical protein